MDVSEILAGHNAKLQSVVVEKEIPLEVDTGLLTVTDLNPFDDEAYNESREEYLQSLATEGIQALVGALFSLPIKRSDDGPLAQLPPPVYQLPRAKPLPKPKPMTKWEAFAKAKGIQHRVRDKKLWDEEKQEWVNRWGKDGKNKEIETQWITEVKANADIDHDPRKVSRDERKARIEKNEKQKLANIARSAGQESRKAEIDKTLATTRISTASMGKYDKKLEGEKKVKGIKRKFESTVVPAESERKASLNLLKKMESDSKKMRVDPRVEESVLNVRKAVRFASKGKGGAALGRELDGKKQKRKSR